MRVLVELDGKWYDRMPEQESFSCSGCDARFGGSCLLARNDTPIHIICRDWVFKESPLPLPLPPETAQLLQDSAQCLDDCLMRIYPEEFSKENVDAALTRFHEGHGILSRVAGLADRLREVGK